MLNDGGTLDVREKGSATGIQQSSQGALVATTRATRVTGTRADGVAFSIEQGAANNILLANGGVLTVESDTSSDKTQVNMGGREIVKTKPLRQARRSPAVNKLSRVWRMRQQLTTAEYKQFQLTERQ